VLHATPVTDTVNTRRLNPGHTRYGSDLPSELGLGYVNPFQRPVVDLPGLEYM